MSKMRALLASSALLALAACAGGQTVPEDLTPMIKAQPTPQAQLGVTRNPIRAANLPRTSSARTVAERLQDANRSAKRNAFSGYFDDADFYYEWKPGLVYEVVLKRNEHTDLMLWPDEGYVNAEYDTNYFEVAKTWAGTESTRNALKGPAGTVIPIVGYEHGICRDASVYTTMRKIRLRLCVTGRGDAYNKAIGWTKPADEHAMMQAAGMFNPVAMDPLTGVPLDLADTRYRFQAPQRGAMTANWRADEWSAMNDRRFTYLIAPPHLGFQPVPAVVGKNGGATPQYEILPTRTDGRSIIKVHGVPQAIALQHGKEAMIVRRGTGT